MIITLKGIRNWIIGLGVIILVIILLVLIFNLMIIILPIIVVMALLGYVFKRFNKLKKETPKEYINVKFKEKDVIKVDFKKKKRKK